MIPSRDLHIHSSSGVPGAGGRRDIASLMDGRVATANPTAKSPIVCIDAVQKPFGAVGALRGVDPYSGREVADCIIGPGVRDESMLLRCIEGLNFPYSISTFRTLLLPGSERPSGGLASGRIVEEGAPASPARSQAGRLRRFSSKPFRRDSQASLSGRIQPANPKGPP